MAAQRFPQHEVMKFRRIFDAMDGDSDGFVTLGDIQPLLRTYVTKPNPEDGFPWPPIPDSMSAMNRRRSSVCSVIDEQKAKVKEEAIPPPPTFNVDELKSFFSWLDTNNDGKINFLEFLNAIWNHLHEKERLLMKAKSAPAKKKKGKKKKTGKSKS
jgi:EF-hand domain pair